MYPLSHNYGKTLSKFFYNILTFHVPPSENISILDPTCGRKHLWKKFLESDLMHRRKLDAYGRLVFSDIKDYGQEIVADINDLNFDREFNCIIYDPPYFFGCENSKDPRKEDYGGYAQTYEELLWFMEFANQRFSQWLKGDGKLIVKCADQYQTKERKFYPHHITWTEALSNFKLIDLFVFIHHRMSPMAFQVKDRPCSVIMHTYFLVFKK